MKINMYERTGVLNNRIEIEKIDNREVFIENRKLTFIYTRNLNNEPMHYESFDFTFTENFGEKDTLVESGKLNVKIMYDRIVDYKKIPNSFLTDLSWIKIVKLRKSFGQTWWQKSENIKWIITSVIALVSLAISIIAIQT